MKASFEFIVIFSGVTRGLSGFFDERTKRTEEEVVRQREYLKVHGDIFKNVLYLIIVPKSLLISDL